MTGLLTGGAVFHDPDGSLTARREALRWYPDDVWRYVLAAAWLRVSQEEAFIGRTGSVGDDIQVLSGDRFTTALTARITDPEVRALLTRLGTRRPGDARAALPGAIDQAVDSVEVLTHPARCREAASVLGLRDDDRAQDIPCPPSTGVSGPGR
ncbi:DUF4037 domain-containing protein [Streptomyces sp. NBC_00727]|uniref:DUF4037 domain-containing protein n=1 Tax=Streptomyces sp. NBC_00727 TaxID=2903675 RepID=UPI003867D750